MDWLKQNYKKIIFLVIVPLCLAGLNFYIISPLFRGEFNKNISSIEVAFFTDAKFISDNFPRLSWNPYWYMGFPFGNVYPPIIPFGIASLHSLFSSISWAQFYRIMMAFFYLLGPVFLYYFVRYLTKRNFAALFAALGYSILPSFSYLFGEASGYSELAGGGPLRMVVLELYGEGPHVSALALIPLALTLFLYALRKPGLGSKIWGAVGIALVALTNWIGLVALVIILIILWLSEILRGEAGRKTKDALKTLLIAYGLIAFWFNLSFLKASIGFGSGSRGEGDIFGHYLKILPLLPILIPILVALSWVLSKKIKKIQGLLFGLLFLGAFLFVTLSWHYRGAAYLPQPGRFMPEVNMAAFILFGIILGAILSLIVGKKEEKKKQNKIRIIIGGVYVVLAMAAIFYFGRGFLASPRELLAPHPDITETYPYQVAEFLKGRVDKNERVFATANVAFWLNYFADIQQVKGAADPAATHPWWGHALYQVLTGENAPKGKSLEMAHLWLKALNTNYIVVNTGVSQDPFGDYKDPHKFENFKAIYEKKGDIVYEVPLENPSLAQVVDEKTYIKLEEPAGGVDYKRIKAYADWVEEKTKPKASFNWLNNQEFEIEAEVREGELISVQIAYDKGWQVMADGRYLKTAKDPIGNLVIYPRDFGKLNIKVERKQTLDFWLGYLITFSTIGVLVWLGIKKRAVEKKEKTPQKAEK